MSLVDRILSILAPYECLGCSREGGLLCAACHPSLLPAAERCYRCQGPSPDAMTCAMCMAPGRPYGVRAAAAYDGAAKELVSRLKFAGARAAARDMAALLAPLVREAGAAVLVPVPTANSRVRTRGYDQARLLARELGRKVRLPCIDLLARSGHTRQLGTDRLHRLSQLEGAFRVRYPERAAGRRIILVDDVMTTGSTMESAAKALHACGAGDIFGVVFARA